MPVEIKEIKATGKVGKMLYASEKGASNTHHAEMYMMHGKKGKGGIKTGAFTFNEQVSKLNINAWPCPDCHKVLLDWSRKSGKELLFLVDEDKGGYVPSTVTWGDTGIILYQRGVATAYNSQSLTDYPNAAEHIGLP